MWIGPREVNLSPEDIPSYNDGRDKKRFIWLIWCRQDVVNMRKDFQLQDETIRVFNFGGGGWDACLEVGGRRRFFGSLPARFIIRLIETIKANRFALKPCITDGNKF